MSGWWVHEVYHGLGPAAVVSWLAWVIASIVLHELAHGWAALSQGDDTPVREGRLTWNPLVHMGPYSLGALLLLGIAWGVMPVNPNRFRRGRLSEILVSGAGPAMNLALAAICMTALGALDGAAAAGVASAPSTAMHFLYMGALLNLVLAAFNLLPVPPLDGSSILAAISNAYARLLQHPNASIAGLALVLVIFVTGAFDAAWGVAANVAEAWAGTVAGAIAPPGS